MKNNLILIFSLVAAILFWGIILFYQKKSQYLLQELSSQGLISDKVSFATQAAAIDTHTLILYHVNHSNYPTFKAQRLLIRNDANTFLFEAKNIQGNLLTYLKTKYPENFDQSLFDYHLQTDLLQKFPLTLAVLDMDNVQADMSFRAERTAPNQIYIQLIFLQNGWTKLRLSAKLTPSQPEASLWQNLSDKTLLFHLDFIDDAWKKRFDTYAQSKGDAFLIDETRYPLTLTKMK